MSNFVSNSDANALMSEIGKKKLTVTDVMPSAASAANEGIPYLYLGATTQDFTNGSIYESQEVTPATDPKTYEWVEKYQSSVDLTYYKRIWGGTKEGWELLTDEQKAQYEYTFFDNDSLEFDINSFQTKELETPITVAGTQQTTVEGALGGLNGIVSHVGMIILSTTLDTEAKVKAIYGGTTWTKIENRFLFGTGTIDMYNDSGTKTSTSVTAKSTGGSTSSTLTVNTIPSHTHGTYYRSNCAGGTSNWGVSDGSSGTSTPTSSTGGSKPHNNMPPYYGVYIWERTA